MKTFFPYSLNNYIFLFLFCYIHTAFSFSQFTNYNSAVGINDILVDNSVVWAASTGGLIQVDPLQDTVTLENDFDNLPDLFLTSLCMDNEGNIWIGSKKGFLVQRSSKRYSVFKSYYASEWDINDMIVFGKYLIIASSKGCSIFDTEKKRVFQNAIFESNVVHSLSIYKDTLYLGCDEGVFKLDISGDNIVASNFNDETIWKKEPTDSIIVSFPVLNDRVLYKSKIAATHNNSLVYGFDSSVADSLDLNYVFRDDLNLSKLPSKLSALAFDNDGNYWFGTEQNYLIRWNGDKWVYYKVNGLTFRYVNKVHIAANGTIWCIPSISWLNINSRRGHPWWLGIAALTSDHWQLYSIENTKNFEHFGDGENFLGMGEDPSGNMWFGTNGTNIRKYNIKTGLWSRYYVGNGSRTTFKFFAEGDYTGWTWGKCDAIATDSSGYMWFSVYNGFPGCVLSYNPAVENPESTDFRYFFPKDSLEPYIKVPRSLNVDVANNIFLGGDTEDDGKLVIFNYAGNPLTGTINRFYTRYGLLKVNDMASSPDSSTWIATGRGLYNFQYNSAGSHSFTEIKDAPVGIITVELESDKKEINYDSYTNPDIFAKVETILWVGTQLDGVHRLTVSKLLRNDGTVASCAIDTTISIKEKDGLIYNSVSHLAMDRKNGHLWIATENGLSKYDLGHTFTEVENNKNISVYPNPYVRSRHNEVVFAKLAPQSVIAIYTIDGRLITQLIASGSNVIKTENTWTIIWKPDSRILPGTYLYTAKIKKESETSRSKAVVGKLLILP